MTKKQLKAMGIDPHEFEVILDDSDVVDVETIDIDDEENE